MNFPRIAHFLSVHLVFLMALAVATGIYWVFDDQSPVGEVTQVIEESIGVPQQGHFSLRRTICVNKAFSALATRSFIDGVVYNVPTSDPGHRMSFSAGCSRQIEVVNVPHSLPPGTYRYQIALQIQLNPLSSITVRLPVVHLQIIPSPHEEVPFTTSR